MHLHQHHTTMAAATHCTAPQCLATRSPRCHRPFSSSVCQRHTAPSAVAHRTSGNSQTSCTAASAADSTAVASKRQLLLAGVLASAVSLPGWQPAQAQSLDDDFAVLPSGLKVLDVRPGEGARPQPGDKVVVHWSGYTKGYQGKRIDNTSVRDEPYEFVLGQGQAIKAFEDAVSSMQVGGIRRVEVPGDHPELSYPRDRSARFTNELISADGKIYKYRYGPQPVELGGQRALDFVLDNETLQDFNRTLLFDIKLLTVRKAAS